MSPSQTKNVTRNVYVLRYKSSFFCISIHGSGRKFLNYILYIITFLYKYFIFYCRKQNVVNLYGPVFSSKVINEINVLHEGKTMIYSDTKPYYCCLFPSIKKTPTLNVLKTNNNHKALL